MAAIITEDTIREFAQALREEEKSKATIIKYSSALEKLMYWLDGEEATKQRLIDYREHLHFRYC